MFQGFFGFLLVLCLLVSPCLKLHGQTQNHCGSALPESGFREVKNVQLSWAIFQSWSYLTHALSSVETGIEWIRGTLKEEISGWVTDCRQESVMTSRCLPLKTERMMSHGCEWERLGAGLGKKLLSVEEVVLHLCNSKQAVCWGARSKGNRGSLLGWGPALCGGRVRNGLETPVFHCRLSLSRGDQGSEEWSLLSGPHN